VATGVGAVCRAEGADEPEPDEDREVQAVQAVARRAGLRPLRTARTEHFLGLGDAPDGFMALTLRDCERLARDYLDYYRARGFDVALPARRLTVVALADDRSFAAYSADRSLVMVPRRRDPPPSVHGYYSRATNRLIVFDHRTLGPQLSARPAADNLRAVAHEGTHLLTYNTGLLDRRGDVPACLAEGLALYGEVRRPTGRTAPGQPNVMRLDDLASVQRRGIPWVPFARLLEDDWLFRSRGTVEQLLAYAESWLLIDLLVRDGSRLPGFRAYLDAIRGRRGPESRLDDARRHLGDLDRLNEDLRSHSVHLLSRPR
jgi:hypothetical protein